MKKILKYIVSVLNYLFGSKTFVVIEEGSPQYNDKLKDIGDNETVYITPWQYNPNTKELNLDTTFSLSPHGTCCLPVTREGDIFIVNTNFFYFGGTYKWNKE